MSEADALQDHRLSALERGVESLQDSHALLNESVIKLTASVKAISIALDDIKGFVIKVASLLGAGGITAVGVGGMMF